VLFGEDALTFLARLRAERNTLYYLDPPYYHPGKALYLNAYRHEDHVAVRDAVRDLNRPWIVSYDDVHEIRKLYVGVRSRRLEMLYSARVPRAGKEVMFFSDRVRVPSQLHANCPLVMR
jgi:DNA adenine methylase